MAEPAKKSASGMFDEFKTYMNTRMDAYKAWEEDEWNKNKDEWTKQGYTRTVDPTNPWGSTWTYNPPKNTSSNPPTQEVGSKPDTKEVISAPPTNTETSSKEPSAITSAALQVVSSEKKGIGQEAVGQSVENSSNDLNTWLNHMTGLGYTKVSRGNGAFHFVDNEGNVYFDDGRMALGGVDFRDYDYKTLPALASKSLNQDDLFILDLLNSGKNAYRYLSNLDFDFRNAFATYLINKYGRDHAMQYGANITKHPEYHPLYSRYLRQFKADNTPVMERKILSYKKYTRKKQKGGTMNRINYFQQGGQPLAPQQAQSPEEQVVALVLAAMLGDLKATQTVNKILEAAKAGDQQAQQLAGMIQQVVDAMKKQQEQQAVAAKYGSKLNYLKSLKFAKGGKTCPECEAKKVELKACGGKNKKKKYFGGGPFDEIEHGNVKVQTPTKYLGNESYSDKPKRVILRHDISSMPNDTLYFDNAKQLRDVLGSTSVRGGLHSEETKDKYGTVDRWGNRNNSKAAARFEQYLR